MRYFFNGKIEKTDDLYTIRIPFNVWEVCKQRDVIDAELVLDNKIIECELIPEEKGKKGNYKIHLQEEDVSHVDTDKEHKLLLHVTGSLIQMNRNSPYSFDNPIRKIDGIDIIIQPEDGICGQTCVAMLANVTILKAYLRRVIPQVSPASCFDRNFVLGINDNASRRKRMRVNRR